VSCLPRLQTERVKDPGHMSFYHSRLGHETTSVVEMQWAHERVDEANLLAADASSFDPMVCIVPCCATYQVK